MADPTQPDIEFVNEQERQFFAEAVLGEEVREFLASQVGRYLHGRAKQEYDACKTEAFDTDPYTAEGKKKWEELHRKAQAAQYFIQWCSDAIINGDQAASMLDQYRNEES